MKKADFYSLVAGIIGGILFALGMCMCLLPEWNAFKPGLAMCITGLIVLMCIPFVRHRHQRKPALHPSGKTIGCIALCTFGILLLGLGMSLCMVWNQIVWGIAAGLAGIIVLLCLIPLFKGLK